MSSRNRILTASASRRTLFKGAVGAAAGFYATGIPGKSYRRARAQDDVLAQILAIPGPGAQPTEADMEKVGELCLRSDKKGKYAGQTVTFIGLNNAGYNVGAILAGLGIGGLAFALAAQDTVANLFGGIMIFIQRLFKVGDRIEIGDFSGYVVAIGVRSTTIQTLTGRLVVVPNRMFNEAPVRKVRWSQELYLVEQKLQLAKDSPPALLQQLKADIETIIDANPYAVEPTVVLDGFTDFALEISYYYLIAPWQAEDEMTFGEPYRKVFAAKSEINFQVLTKVHESGLRQTGLQINAETVLSAHLLTSARQLPS